MAYIKDTGTPGANNAKLPTGAVLDTGAKTLSLEVDTDVQSAVVLEEKQWIVLETRNINGTANLTGECIYSEDATDLVDVLTFVNDVRNRMILLHTTFDISATHYKTGSVIDVYRGDEATAAILEVVDTNVTLTPPTVWAIDDLTPFAPSIIVADNNIAIDSGCDDSAQWVGLGAYAAITGSKLDINNTSGGGLGVSFNLSELLEEGISYKIGCNVNSTNGIGYRFYIGVTSSGFKYSAGDVEEVITYTSGVNDKAKIQFLDGFVGVLDDFFVERN